MMETQTCYIVHRAGYTRSSTQTFVADVPPCSHTMVSKGSSIARVGVLFVLSTACSEAFVPVSGVTGSVRVGGPSASSRTATCARTRSGVCMSTADDHDILLRVAKGEKADRAPVWLMRQVGVFDRPSFCSSMVKIWVSCSLLKCVRRRHAVRGTRVDTTSMISYTILIVHYNSLDQRTVLPTRRLSFANHGRCLLLRLHTSQT